MNQNIVRSIFFSRSPPINLTASLISPIKLLSVFPQRWIIKINLSHAYFVWNYYQKILTINEPKRLPRLLLLKKPAYQSRCIYAVAVTTYKYVTMATILGHSLAFVCHSLCDGGDQCCPLSTAVLR